MKYIIIILTVILALSSCRKEIVFDQEERESKIVINSLFTTDSTWVAHISRSTNVLDTADYSSINNASVLVFDASDNLVATLTHTQNGVYLDSTSTPMENQNYRIEVSASKFPSATATNYIPTSVPILSIDTASATNAEGMTILQVDVVIDDPEGIVNYYFVEMRVIGEYEAWWKGGDDELGEGEIITFNERLEISSNDPNLFTMHSFNMNGFENTYNYLLLSDENFDGQDYTLSFSVINWQAWKEIDLLGQIRLLNASEAFYNFRTSYERYDQANGNPFAQPVQVYSNVDGGMGVFAGGTLTVFGVDF